MKIDLFEFAKSSAAMKVTQKMEDLDKAIISPSGLVSPSLKSVRKFDDLSKQARHCKVCGATDIFTGAMFTTDSSSGICDDCYG